MNKKLLPWLIAFCALGLGGTAAYYSIIGLSKLFAGVTTAVIIMASFLEISKLTLATYLHSYWIQLGKLSKLYYTTSVVILSFITSIGIYGMLSHGYQETATKSGTIDSKISLVETKRDNIREQLSTYTGEKESITKAISDLRSGLANNVITYTNAEGQLITTTSSSTRRALEKQLDQAILRQTKINSKVDELNEKLFEYETEIVEVSTNSELAGELGPLKYLSGLTGWGMDKIINILLLVIIFVFDPLAIALVIAANFAFERLKDNYKENIYGEKVPVEGSTINLSKKDIDTIVESNNSPPPPNVELKSDAEVYKNTPKQQPQTKFQKMVDKVKKKDNNDLKKIY